MRILIFANSDEAVKLFMAFKLGAAPRVCMLMGGMPPDIVAEQIAAFDGDENGVMIATAVYQSYWTSAKPAAIFILDQFFGSPSQAYRRAPSPTEPMPTVDMLLRMMGVSSDEPITQESDTGVKQLQAPAGKSKRPLRRAPRK